MGDLGAFFLAPVAHRLAETAQYIIIMVKYRIQTLLCQCAVLHATGARNKAHDSRADRFRAFQAPFGMVVEALRLVTGEGATGDC